MIATSIKISAATGTAVVGVTATLADVFSADVRDCKKAISISQSPIMLETEGATIDITFRRAFGQFSKGANFAVTGHVVATLRPETGDVFFTGEGKWLAQVGCRMVRK
jgi:hypothetical protein